MNYLYWQAFHRFAMAMSFGTVWLISAREL